MATRQTAETYKQRAAEFAEARRRLDTCRDVLEHPGHASQKSHGNWARTTASGKPVTGGMRLRAALGGAASPDVLTKAVKHGAIGAGISYAVGSYLGVPPAMRKEMVKKGAKQSALLSGGLTAFTRAKRGASMGPDLPRRSAGEALRDWREYSWPNRRKALKRIQSLPKEKQVAAAEDYIRKSGREIMVGYDDKGRVRFMNRGSRHSVSAGFTNIGRTGDVAGATHVHPLEGADYLSGGDIIFSATTGDRISSVTPSGKRSGKLKIRANPFEDPLLRQLPEGFAIKKAVVAHHKDIKRKSWGVKEYTRRGAKLQRRAGGPAKLMRSELRKVEREHRTKVGRSRTRIGRRYHGWRAEGAKRARRRVEESYELLEHPGHANQKVHGNWARGAGGRLGSSQNTDRLKKAATAAAVVGAGALVLKSRRRPPRIQGSPEYGLAAPSLRGVGKKLGEIGRGLSGGGKRKPRIILKPPPDIAVRGPLGQPWLRPIPVRPDRRVGRLRASSYRQVSKQLRSMGIEEVPGRGRGSHRIWLNPSTGRTAPLPYHSSGRTVPTGTLRSFARQLGLSPRALVRESSPLYPVWPTMYLDVLEHPGHANQKSHGNWAHGIRAKMGTPENRARLKKAAKAGAVVGGTALAWRGARNLGLVPGPIEAVKYSRPMFDRKMAQIRTLPKGQQFREFEKYASGSGHIEIGATFTKRGKMLMARRGDKYGVPIPITITPPGMPKPDVHVVTHSHPRTSIRGPRGEPTLSLNDIAATPAYRGGIVRAVQGGGRGRGQTVTARLNPVWQGLPVEKVIRAIQGAEHAGTARSVETSLKPGSVSRRALRARDAYDAVVGISPNTMLRFARRAPKRVKRQIGYAGLYSSRSRGRRAGQSPPTRYVNLGIYDRHDFLKTRSRAQYRAKFGVPFREHRGRINSGSSARTVAKRLKRGLRLRESYLDLYEHPGHANQAVHGNWARGIRSRASGRRMLQYGVQKAGGKRAFAKQSLRKAPGAIAKSKFARSLGLSFVVPPATSAGIWATKQMWRPNVAVAKKLAKTKSGRAALARAAAEHRKAQRKSSKYRRTIGAARDVHRSGAIRGGFEGALINSPWGPTGMAYGAAEGAGLRLLGYKMRTRKRSRRVRETTMAHTEKTRAADALDVREVMPTSTRRGSSGVHTPKKRRSSLMRGGRYTTFKPGQPLPKRQKPQYKSKFKGARKTTKRPAATISESQRELLEHPGHANQKVHGNWASGGRGTAAIGAAGAGLAVAGKVAMKKGRKLQDAGRVAYRVGKEARAVLSGPVKHRYATSMEKYLWQSHGRLARTGLREIRKGRRIQKGGKAAVVVGAGITLGAGAKHAHTRLKKRRVKESYLDLYEHPGHANQKVHGNWSKGVRKATRAVKGLVPGKETRRDIAKVGAAALVAGGVAAFGTHQKNKMIRRALMGTAARHPDRRTRQVAQVAMERMGNDRINAAKSAIDWGSMGAGLAITSTSKRHRKASRDRSLSKEQRRAATNRAANRQLVGAAAFYGGAFGVPSKVAFRAGRSGLGKSAMRGVKRGVERGVKRGKTARGLPTPQIIDLKPKQYRWK